MTVTVEQVSYSYDDRRALEDVSFQVAEGQIFGLLGPNGGGKSTLFRILSTVMNPSSGRVVIDGHDTRREPAAVRRAIGVVFQSQSLDRKLTVAENLRAQGHFYGLSGSLLAARMGEAMERLNLTDRRGDLVQSLSGGYQRRVEIAKAILHRPRVLLMDEPSTGLDPAARRELAHYVQELRERHGVTVLLTTHILDEADRCDRLVLLHQGRCVAEGSPSELKTRVGGDVVIFRSHDPEALRTAIAGRFHISPKILDGNLRIEIANGYRFVTEVVEALPGSVESAAVHRPTLEDVFLDETGATIGG
ncbi:MAG: ATP-binding cassette domain-containing protein [Bryobacterales bacterium]|nr:ATP-binding cassette domain-containing protein [Bryobacterales bacterium]